MSNWSIAIERALENNIPKVDTILEKYPYLSTMADEIRESKLNVIGNLDSYVKMTMESIESTGGKAYLAKNVADAQEILKKIVGTGKKIVMAKSNVAHEIDTIFFSISCASATVFARYALPPVDSMDSMVILT